MSKRYRGKTLAKTEARNPKLKTVLSTSETIATMFAVTKS